MESRLSDLSDYKRLNLTFKEDKLLQQGFKTNTRLWIMSFKLYDSHKINLDSPLKQSNPTPRKPFFKIQKHIVEEVQKKKLPLLKISQSLTLRKKDRQSDVINEDKSIKVTKLLSDLDSRRNKEFEEVTQIVQQMNKSHYGFMRRWGYRPKSVHFSMDERDQ